MRARESAGGQVTNKMIPLLGPGPQGPRPLLRDMLCCPRALLLREAALGAGEKPSTDQVPSTLEMTHIFVRPASRQNKDLIKLKRDN